MSPLLVFFFLILFFITTTNPLQCHQCGGAERMSRTTKRLYMDLNISPDLYYGNCRSTSGNDVCTNGTFCIKRRFIELVSNGSTINIQLTQRDVPISVRTTDKI
ncbi:unnamed protein product [Caenorhabditis nigoni]